MEAVYVCGLPAGTEADFTRIFKQFGRLKWRLVKNEPPAVNGFLFVQSPHHAKALAEVLGKITIAGRGIQTFHTEVSSDATIQSVTRLPENLMVSRIKAGLEGLLAPRSHEKPIETGDNTLDPLIYTSEQMEMLKEEINKFRAETSQNDQTPSYEERVRMFIRPSEPAQEQDPDDELTAYENFDHASKINGWKQNPESVDKLWSQFLDRQSQIENDRQQTRKSLERYRTSSHERLEFWKKYSELDPPQQTLPAADRSAIRRKEAEIDKENVQRLAELRPPITRELVEKSVVDYFGEAEPSLIDFIMGSLDSREELIKNLTETLEEDAEDFVGGFWPSA